MAVHPKGALRMSPLLVFQKRHPVYTRLAPLENFVPIVPECLDPKDKLVRRKYVSRKFESIHRNANPTNIYDDLGFIAITESRVP
jgi:hypothetical protein